MKVKVIKRYSDIRLHKVIESGTVLEVDEARADQLVKEGMAEIVKEPAKTAQRKEQVIQLSPFGTQGDASYFYAPKRG